MTVELWEAQKSEDCVGLGVPNLTRKLKRDETDRCKEGNSHSTMFTFDYVIYESLSSKWHPPAGVRPGSRPRAGADAALEPRGPGHSEAPRRGSAGRCVHERGLMFGTST